MHQSTVYDTSRIASIFFVSLLDLKEIVVHVFDLSAAVSLVADELPLIQTAIKESHFTSPDSLVIHPVSLKEFAILIVASSLAVSPVIAVVAFVVTAILEHDFNSSVQRHHTMLKPAL